ncbi:E3 ubiquitin-protein ligase MIB2-like [Sycon ciliatum]|uniref:E3 ubiquitin-protein ligase MIB2-like n=1 Tax=Sycon ciliatum TaxID=27933 RepID=UPI0031F6586F
MPVRVGTRVVRGPDWKWSSQDKRSGNLGTVFKGTASQGWVSVHWDHGHTANYRCGADGKYDISIYDNAAGGVAHRGITCDCCRSDNVTGVRWKCSVCYDYDLCNRCFHKGAHDKAHQFYRIDEKDGPWILTPRRTSSSRSQLLGIVPGAVVARGPDWKWGPQDGGPLGALLGVKGQGKVLAVRDWSEDGSTGKMDAARISWAAGGTNNYRVGYEGNVDLKAVQDPSSSDSDALYYYPEHLAAIGKHYSSETCGAFSVGDPVKITTSLDSLRRAQSGTPECSWDSRMSQFPGLIGRVRNFPTRNSANVEVHVAGLGRSFQISLSALQAMAVQRVGDRVRVTSSKAEAVLHQRGHGGWNEAMAGVLGKVGQIVNIDSDGDARVRFSNGQSWTFSPRCLTHVSRGAVDSSTLKESDDSDQMMRMLGRLLGIPDGGGDDSGDSGFVRLYNASSEGDAEKVREVLKSDRSVINRTHNGVCPLQVAAYKGKTGCLNALLDSGANTELKDNDGDTALAFAIAGNESSCARILLDHGANANARNNKGQAALHIACHNGYIQCVRVLVRHGVSTSLKDNDGFTPLHVAILRDKPDVIEVLLEHRVDVYQSTDNGSNALHIACSRESLGAVRKLLRYDRKLVNVTNNEGVAPLHIATKEKNTEIAKVLIEQYNCDVNITAKKGGQTALHVAVYDGCNAMIELLVGSGSRINATDSDGDTPLHLALLQSGESSRSGQEAILRAALLASMGISDRQSIDKDGWVAIACYLALHGADLSMRNKKGKTALDFLKDQSQAVHIKQCARVYQRKHAPQAQSDGIRVRASCDDDNGIRVTTGDGIRVGAVDTTPPQPTPSNEQWNIPPVSPRTRQTPSQSTASASSSSATASPQHLSSPTKPVPAKRKTAVNTNISSDINTIGTSNICHQKTKGVTDGACGDATAAAAAVNNGAESAPESTGDKPLCSVCDRPANVCCLPCTHVSLCDECSGRAKKCLACMKALDGKKTLTTCLLCDSDLGAVVFLPCNHCSLCVDCAKRATKCPECRAQVSEKYYNGSKL